MSFPAVNHANDAALSASQAWIMSSCRSEDRSQNDALMQVFRESSQSRVISMHDNFLNDPANFAVDGLSFGREMRRLLFRLDPDAVYLNHGSYGAACAPALELQAIHRSLMERNGIAYMEAVPHLLRRVSERLGRFVGVKEQPAQGVVAMMRNATTAIAAVLRSMKFRPHQELLMFRFGYGAVKNVGHLVGSTDQCKLRLVDVALDSLSGPDGSAVADAVCTALERAIVPQQTAVAVFDHIVSSLAVVLPVARLCAICKRLGVVSVVDGAHAVGHIPLDLPSLGCDMYVSNCHKWLMAPKGSAFLYVRDPALFPVHPLTVSHGYLYGMDAEFQWQATDDYSAFFATEACLQLFERIDFDRIRSYNHSLALKAGRDLADAWSEVAASGAVTAVDAPPAASSSAACGFLSSVPDEQYANMALVRLPPLGGKFVISNDAAGAEFFRVAYLRSQYGIEVPVLCFSPGVWFVRISAQIYLDEADFERLKQAILDASPS